MSEPFTPDTKVVRDAYADWETINSDGADPAKLAVAWGNRADEFDRWLAKHDAGIREREANRYKAGIGNRDIIMAEMQKEIDRLEACGNDRQEES